MEEELNIIKKNITDLYDQIEDIEIKIKEEYKKLFDSIIEKYCLPLEYHPGWPDSCYSYTYHKYKKEPIIIYLSDEEYEITAIDYTELYKIKKK